MKEQYSSKKIIVFIFILIFFIFLFLSILLFFLLFHFFTSSSPLSLKFRTAQLMEIDFHSNRTKYAIVRLPENTFKKNEDNFITYRNRNTGTFNVITSDFPTKRFRCTGSCVCRKNTNRRSTRASVVLKNGIVFVLSAISMHLAIKISEKAIIENCVQEFRGECGEYDLDPDLTCEESDLEVVADPEGGESQFMTFRCTGRCENISEEELGFDPEGEDVERLFDDCSDLRQTRELIVSKIFGKVAEDFTLSPEIIQQFARRKFTKVHLIKFCEEVSNVIHVENEEEKYASICIGYKKGNFKEILDNVECVESDWKKPDPGPHYVE